MALTVSTNLQAMQAYQNLNKTSSDMAASMARLSSGQRINTAADDAAGLAISEGLASQVDGSKVAARNAQDGINVLQTADGALAEVDSIMQRMRDLAVQAANDSNNAASRKAIAAEGQALGQQLYGITRGTNFNGIQLLNGGPAATNLKLTFQVGAGGNPKANQITADLGCLGVSLSVNPSGSSLLDLSGAKVTFYYDGSHKFAFQVGTAADARQTISNLDQSMTVVGRQRTQIGATQNRLVHALSVVNSRAQNLDAAKSHISDTDMAQEMVAYTKDSILSQAGTAMLAQANQTGQGILKLLG